MSDDASELVTSWQGSIDVATALAVGVELAIGVAVAVGVGVVATGVVVALDTGCAVPVGLVEDVPHAASGSAQPPMSRTTNFDTFMGLYS
ncbi:MAG: hypothetical protein ACLQGJ_12780 [Candidatus Dormibacteria bacterium]